MDPTVNYRELYEALRDNELERARELALALRGWLDGGGFYPANENPATVRRVVAATLWKTRNIEL